MFILKHDQYKISKPNQSLAEKQYHVMLPPAYFHGNLIRWRSPCIGPTKWLTVGTFCSNTQKLLILCVIPKVIPVGCSVAEMFFLVKQIDNWFRNNMLTDLLVDLAIIAVHRQTILICKTDICNAFMSIHSRRIIGSSFFIEIMTVISDFL